MATFFQLGSWIVILLCSVLVQDYSDGVIVVKEKDDSPDEHFGSDDDNAGFDEHINASSNCTVGAKITFQLPFLTRQEKRSRMDHAIGVPCLLYALRIFSNHLFGVETT